MHTDSRRHAGVIALILLAWLAGSRPALAVGLGNAQVRSALNQRLDVHIPITGLKAGEADSLRVRLAGNDAFERAGLDRAAVPPGLHFELHSAGQRRGWVRIRTRNAVREPHVGLVLELQAADKMVQRSYDLLLSFPQ